MTDPKQLKEKHLKKAFHLAISNFERAGFKIKDCYFDDYYKDIEERNKYYNDAKTAIETPGSVASELMEIFSKGIDDISDRVHDTLENTPYRFNSPYVIFYFPEDAIMLPMLANNLPSMMDLQIVQEVTEEDYSSNKSEFVSYNLFKYNHSGRRPVIALSIIESLVDLYNPENYKAVREEFFKYFYELSTEILEGYTQWTSMMEMLDITEKKKPKEVNIDLTKSKEKKETDKEDGN